MVNTWYLSENLGNKSLLSFRIAELNALMQDSSLILITYRLLSISIVNFHFIVISTEPVNEQLSVKRNLSIIWNSWQFLFDACETPEFDSCLYCSKVRGRNPSLCQEFAGCAVIKLMDRFWYLISSPKLPFLRVYEYVCSHGAKN